MDMDFSTFKERLARLMESRGYCIRTLAEAINITPATVSRYLSGARKPDIEYLVKIANHFNVSLDWLMGLSGNRFDVLPQEVQDIAYWYSIATDSDKIVIQAVLNKYKKE